MHLVFIGLTGKNGSGKGEVVKFLRECGFESLSLSDVIREELRRKRLPVTRERLIETGTRLRERGGPSILAEKTLAKLASDRNYVIDSIRNPEEAKTLRGRNGFFLLNITAPRSVRFARIKKRARERDPRTLRDFIRMEEREFQSKNPASQQLLATEKEADAKVDNNRDLKNLHEKIRSIVLKLAQSRPRPDWDVYFMDIARMVSLRSNCVKRHVAAVLVKDRRIIATGYNGTPRGVRNCNEGGCPRCNSFGKSGSNLSECLCSHAEENAITQSAYHGVNIKEATLYTTFSPCLICTKMIINSGLKEVVYDVHYPLADVAKRLLREAGLKVRRMG